MEGDNYDSLRNHGKSIKKGLKDLRERILPKEMQGFSNDPELLSSKLQVAGNVASSVLVPATKNDEIKLEFAEKAIKEFVQEFDKYFSNDWKVYTDYVDSMEISLVKSY
jgi:hypothetical protein